MHAHQAINWYPWGQDAFDLAKITNKPLFLSIGYSSCHWCHVMSDKTFDKTDIMDLLNQYFVAIKIDRDQHPDIDHTYMLATQLLTAWWLAKFSVLFANWAAFLCGHIFSA